MKTTIPVPVHFMQRHIGPSADEISEMLKVVGVSDFEELVNRTMPDAIRNHRELDLPPAMSEHDYLRHIRSIADKNTVYRSYIGQGYYGTITPSVILRNVFENPGWYTQYTPYQAEIAQGRLEALLNFQTVVSDLTGMPLANASLLDEGTAAAEAMSMFFSVKNRRIRKPDAYIRKFFVDRSVYPQTLDVLKARAEPLGIQLIVGDWKRFEPNDDTFGVLLQYPSKDGMIEDYRSFVKQMKDSDLMVGVATDLLALMVLDPPGHWGVDAVVGSAQRFGVPMGYGGPHAAFFTTTENFKRQLPGRIIGISQDRHGKMALRMALQTREQHIRREKATSNICTAQALLAIMSGMYAVYHGPEYLREIAERVHGFASILAERLLELGYTLRYDSFFDTLCIEADSDLQERLMRLSRQRRINFYYAPGLVQVSLDETVSETDMQDLNWIFAKAMEKNAEPLQTESYQPHLPEALLRPSDYLTHPVFHRYRTETEMMRYLKRLENKDLSLVHSMISLGSCTMKLNAATELIPVSWPAFANIHPYVPADQVVGYSEMISELEQYLCEITGLAACSLQPNSGAQGEFTGLLTIRAYHEANGNTNRSIALIPLSAHGTNPASAVMAGMTVKGVLTDENGNIDIENLKKLVDEYSEELAVLMVTYPSTHGVFETHIKEVCDLVHKHGGMVYMDGANMNAQVGLTSPGFIGADVCHLNLHKTFAIPHGGGGPGMGPICVNESLAPYLPKHAYVNTGGNLGIHAIASAAFGSASILLISYAYIRMLGAKGLTEATLTAILNANYMRKRLEGAYKVVYTGEVGFCAHEFIIDIQAFHSDSFGVEDVAKRLIDYGFHAPTMSFPVPGTMMIEPTESESKEEMDRFCDALLSIREEIEELVSGEKTSAESPLCNAPHTLAMITADKWPYAYSRSDAAYPLDYIDPATKFWSSVSRVENAYGDRNLVCTCPPMEAYEDTEVLQK